MRRLIGCYFFLLCIYYAPLVNAQPAPCTAKDGSGIVACVAKAYPDRLAGNVSLSERTLHMQFLRDRIIETARCAGLDVGLNLKRGGPSISNDFIAWKVNGHVEGVDIASRYDDPVPPLKLQWHTYKAPDYGFPTYKAYGAVSCVAPAPVPVPTPTPEPPDADVIKRFEEKFKQIDAALKEQASNFNKAVAALELISGELKKHTARMDGLETDLPALRSRVYKLEQIPVPLGYKCSGRAAFGIPISCSVTADVNP